MTVYDFTVKNAKGEEESLSKFKGKVLLIVNTATKCGLTPQYEALEALYLKYKDKGFEILDFPCNQFMGQAPGSIEEITEFCTLNYGTTFPRFSKVEVNGKNAAPLYVWLKEQAPKDEEDDEARKFDQKIKLLKPFSKPEDIKWNFGKFLIDQNGEIKARYSPAFQIKTIDEKIGALL
jgi:glutathione peroxidase